MRTASWFLGLLAASALFNACSISDENDATENGSGGYSTTSSGSGGATATSTGGAASSGGGAGQGGDINEVTSPGLIACGDGACDSTTDICCDGACVGAAMDCPPTLTADATQDANSNPVGAVHCDDAADCTGNEMCCVDWDASGPGEIYECVASCQLHEACIPGGVCKTPGFLCVTDPTEFSGAKCVSPGGTVECEGTTCQGDTPVCCATDSSCGAYDSACNVPVECLDAGDCGAGMLCCGKVGSGSTYCAADCVDDVVLCTGANDCTGGNGTCQDAPDPLPPTAQSCQ